MTKTENGALALKTSENSIVDLFYTIGASRGRNIIDLFEEAFKFSKEEAVRVALWARDVRGGAGERQLFRDILLFLEKNDFDIFQSVILKVPELGRWDDLLEVKTKLGFKLVAKMIKKQIDEDCKNVKPSLAAKWMPRKGRVAVKLKNEWKMTPKKYRKYLVNNTKVVETDMCQNKWEEIIFKQIPSLAMTRYSNAFKRHVEENFEEFIKEVQKGNVKINVGAVYPYDVIKTLEKGDEAVAEEMWKLLPHFLNEGSILPMVDVSGSMTGPAGGNKALSCMEVAISLGLYISSKQKGTFKDLVLTFDKNPIFVSFENKPTLKEKLAHIRNMPWGMNTNLALAFDHILNMAKRHNATAEEMPESLVILSDMEFDTAISNADSKHLITLFESFTEKYKDSGYKKPVIIFWNLQSRNEHVPVKFCETGVILVSGFSPSLLKSILGRPLEKITPIQIVHDVISVDRYNF